MSIQRLKDTARKRKPCVVVEKLMSRLAPSHVVLLEHCRDGAMASFLGLEQTPIVAVSWVVLC